MTTRKYVFTANEIEAAATRCECFDDKAFIVDVAYQLGVPCDDAFKTALVAMQMAGQIKLSRCDLVQAFDSRDVAESETRRGVAEFHFVRLTRPTARQYSGQLSWRSAGPVIDRATVERVLAAAVAAGWTGSFDAYAIDKVMAAI